MAEAELAEQQTELAEPVAVGLLDFLRVPTAQQTLVAVVAERVQITLTEPAAVE